VSENDGLREQKKRATRETISAVATRLFLERGFDNVTVAEVAAAANVSKMTVFNYFPRKEDLFFDREQEGNELIERALLERAPHISPLGALHALALRLQQERHAFAKMTDSVVAFWRTVEESPALSARSHELRAEMEAALPRLLAKAVGRPEPDVDAQLVGSVLLAGWLTAYREARRLQRAHEKRSVVDSALTMLMERAFQVAEAAARGTPYGSTADFEP
jgi:AcrR family transcriptional regulator